MNRIRLAIVCLAVSGFAATSASAVVIDFGDVLDGDFFPTETYSEDGFTFEVISGTQWALTAFGNPGSALEAGDSLPHTAGDTIVVTADGGGLFTFDAVDFRSLGDITSDGVNFVGLVDGIETELYSNLFGTTEAYTTGFDPSFAAPIDELRIVANSVGGQSLALDNFVFNEVIPAPAALPAGLIGLGAMVMRRRRRAA